MNVHTSLPEVHKIHRDLAYRSDIDGLRTIAVLSVVGFHAFPKWVTGGFVGVDVFFVISGYLISGIIIRSLDQGTFSFADFYSRRIRRIFPALFAVLLVSFFFGWQFLLADEFKRLGLHIAGGAGFVSNFVLWNESGYFDAAADSKPLLHLWSLGIEEQFYIAYPLVLWIFWKRNVNQLAITVLVLLASLTWNIFQNTTNPIADFYSPLARFWELMIGGVLAQVTLRNSGAACNIRSVSGIALLAISLLVLSKESLYPGWLALVPTAGAALLISAGSGGWINRFILSNHLMVGIGLISYPLYLWHWMLLSFARIVEGGVPSLKIKIGAVVVSFALAWLTYVLIEKPLRFGQQGRVKTLLLVAIMAMVGCAGLAAYEDRGFPRRAIEVGREGVLDYRTHWIGWDRCHLVAIEDDNSGGCRILKKNKPVGVMLIGDSHAGHLATGLRKQSIAKDINIAILLYPACFPFFPVLSDGKEYFSCSHDFIKNSLEYAIMTPSIKVVLLSGYAGLVLHQARLYSEEKKISKDAFDSNVVAFEAGMNATLEKLERAGKKVVYIVDNPELIDDPASCVDRHVPFVSPHCDLDLPRKNVMERNSAHYRLLENYKARHPNLIIASIPDALCTESVCRGVIDGMLLYASRDHLSPAGSEYVVNRIWPAIETALQ